MKKVLIICTGNSCRSQMAEGWIREFIDDKIHLFSAGTHPEPVNPIAVKVMEMASIDISYYQSNLIDDYLSLDLDYVITVCDSAKELCPTFPTAGKIIHQSFPDPAKAEGSAEQILSTYISVRDMLKSFCKDFVQTELRIMI
ncbi:MAG: arsenate reductase ArsC [Bacteroidota bacterium]|nr:arsenate reductase ArsC [Bacteroidota bacterium]